MMTVVPFERLNKNDSLLLILDLQTGLYGLARDFDPMLYYNNMIAHAAIGQLFGIPVILSTSAQSGPNGNLPKEILGMCFRPRLRIRTYRGRVTRNTFLEEC